MERVQNLKNVIGQPLVNKSFIFNSEVELVAHESKNLDTICFRGSAPLAHLALISQTDIFDQVTNPDGLQRDLSPKHASQAYEYVHRENRPDYPRAFPEVVLNVRDRRILQTGENNNSEIRMKFSVSAMSDNKKIYVSRVDGNHRLHHARGDDRRVPLLPAVPFQIHIGLTREQERSLFVDINSNQKGLNSSHLHVMQSRLTDEQQEIRDNTDRWITRNLAEDPESPWHGLIHMGGSKKGTRSQGLTRLVNFASVQGGVTKLLQKSQYIHDLGEPKLQYIVIRNYWSAVKKVFSQEWGDYKQHLLLKNIGVWTLSILAGAIIDRCMPRGKVDIEDFSRHLLQVRNRFDWNKDAKGERAVSGMSGNRAALILAGAMAEELTEESGSNLLQSIQDRLRTQVSTQ